MSLLGSTAINDELQDNLEDTLDFFIKTGIKIWVLTGDKFDTAKSIAFSSKLITHYFKIFEFYNLTDIEEINEKLEKFLLDYKEFQESKSIYLANLEKNRKKLVNLDIEEKSLLNNYDNVKTNALDLNKIKDLKNKLIEECEMSDEKKKYNETKFAILIGSNELAIIMENPILQENVMFNFYLAIYLIIINFSMALN